LSNVNDLKLNFLNQATQAWVEMEYNKRDHDGIGTTPINKFIRIKNVGRPSPSSEQLRFMFTSKVTRKQRRSDGTLQIDGVRYEVPSRFRHMHTLNLRYQTWDLSRAYIVDEKTGDLLALITPEDKHKNASGKRRCLEPVETTACRPPEDPVPPLLKQLLKDFSATGLPAGYIPQPDINRKKSSDK